MHRCRKNASNSITAPSSWRPWPSPWCGRRGPCCGSPCRRRGRAEARRASTERAASTACTESRTRCSRWRHGYTPPATARRSSGSWWTPSSSPHTWAPDEHAHKKLHLRDVKHTQIDAIDAKVPDSSFSRTCVLLGISFLVVGTAYKLQWTW